MRTGTTIIKWHRVNAKKGCYEWHNLKCQVGHPTLSVSEDDFSIFVSKTITANPKALYIESSVWEDKEAIKQLSLPFDFM
ncbi:MAG: SinI family restriction endonuclease [Symplocastrum torsivum CPER-KK1]|uniref:SinI family restriction endonuclease n=1 Tax=Symplocastrum torsivum CPER-KK1 TaxID=450513 RepID=A0A951UD54_9CYAN|nr:SinI family restriction endonuclease [Symplocastrum torsivum CPER-KK1]